MGKSSFRSKNKNNRSTQSLPKGIPHRRSSSDAKTSPFDNALAVKTKHHVHNRVVSKPRKDTERQTTQRNTRLAAVLSREKKANEFLDRRIGERRNGGADYGRTNEDFMLQRIVKERVRRSKNMYSLDEDGEDDGLTHKGKTIDESFQFGSSNDVILSDNDDEDLDRVDTALHFGGGKFDRENARESGVYGNPAEVDLGRVYRSRKEELEERVKRKKMEKAEKIKRKEDQVDTFETMDESFADLAKLLQFRDKEQERIERSKAKKMGSLSAADVEMDDWDKEMKEYLFERKVKATDRTKTKEEIVKEEADRLHKLETRRLARMHGDFDNDDLSDISDDDATGGRKKRKRGSMKKEKVKKDHLNPEELSDSDEDEKKGDDGREVRFTADGLVYLDTEGNVVGKVGQEGEDDAGSEESGNDSEENSHSSEHEGHDTADSVDEISSADSADDESGDESVDSPPELTKGIKVQGNYRAKKQYRGKENWYNGVITAVRTDDDGNMLYDITYDDGDFEEGMIKANVRLLPKSKEELDEEKAKTDVVSMAKRRKQKARTRAKVAMPFVFEVPTTLETLHDMIARHASTGADVSLIIQRIHATNSVRLNHKNKERMQNFYDVLLRRFIAVGDEIFNSGNGGPDLERYKQLDSITKTIYSMSQDSPDCAGAVWSRRLGVFQKALAKRLRDVEVTPLGDACIGEFTAWPSTGMLLLMRALPQIFPSTDRRHAVVTPALLLLGQIVAQTPVKSRYDIIMGLFCSGLMLEYTRDAKRLSPEAIAYLASVLRLFADDVESSLSDSPLPSLGFGNKALGYALRKQLSVMQDKDARTLSLEKSSIQNDNVAWAIFNFALHLIKKAFVIFGTSEGSEREIFAEIMKSLLCFDGTNRSLSLPLSIRNEIAEIARIASALDGPRAPLQRRKAATAKELAIKTYAPRMEDPDRYSMSKDKGKSQLQAEHDRHRREYKREHKATMRELRLDSAFVENERRKAKDENDKQAREKRHKNFAWMEMEQATMNHQVRLGGGLLSGGGIGAAKQKARTGKLGIKKGGKL